MELRYRYLRYFDVAAVLCLAVLPDLVRSICIYTNTVQRVSYSFSYMHGALLARSIQVSVPILLIMFLRRVNWSEHGFRSVRLLRDPLVAFGLIVISYVAYAMVYNLILQFGINDQAGVERTEAMIRGMSPTSWVAVLVMLASSIANGFAEELALRSYLLPRLLQLSGSRVFAVLLTSSLFGAYHIYQGVMGAIAIFVVGIVFGTYFVAKRRFWPIALAHMAMDVIPQLLYLGAEST